MTGAGPNPSVETARRHLGGRGSTTAEAGGIVSIEGKGGVAAIGVVLFASESEVDVWIDEGIVRRLAPWQVTPFAGVVPETLLQLAADAKAFAELREGQRVRYATKGGVASDGAIVEKCRFGALVLREDGKLMAVGFRKVWSLSPTHTAAN